MLLRWEFFRENQYERVTELYTIYQECDMQIRTVLIDDEPDGCDALELMLRSYCPSVEVVGSTTSFESGLELVERISPDLLFLDIEMPYGSGFDLLARFSDPSFETIFTTAYAQYAYQAFRVQALDYLLKPVLPEPLIESVQRAEKRLLERRTIDAESIDSLENLLSVLVDKSVHSNRIALRTAESIEFIQVKDIIRCEAEKSYTVFFLVDGQKLMISKNLVEFEETLAAFHFLRVHHSHLINVAHIRRYVKGNGGRLIMSDGSEIVLPRRRKDELIRAITNALAGKV